MHQNQRVQQKSNCLVTENTCECICMIKGNGKGTGFKSSLKQTCSADYTLPQIIGPVHSWAFLISPGRIQPGCTLAYRTDHSYNRIQCPHCTNLLLWYEAWEETWSPTFQWFFTTETHTVPVKTQTAEIVGHYTAQAPLYP